MKRHPQVFLLSTVSTYNNHFELCAFSMRIFIYFLYRDCFYKRVRTNELMRTFDLYYVTRSNLRKHACRSYYISANYPSNNSSPNRRNFEKTFLPHANDTVGTPKKTAAANCVIVYMVLCSSSKSESLLDWYTIRIS